MNRVGMREEKYTCAGKKRQTGRQAVEIVLDRKIAAF